MLGFVMLSAASAAPDCALDTDGYLELRRQLRQLRVAQGHPIVAAGDTDACDEALGDVLRSDPFMGIRQADGAGPAGVRVSRTLDPYVHCGVVVAPATGGFVLREVGECTSPPTDSAQRIRSVGLWTPGELVSTPGVAVRWTESAGGGTAVLLDAAVDVRAEAWAEPTAPTWRLLAGVDLSELGLETSLVIGGRAGAQGWASTVQPVGQLVVGHRWVSRSLALQAGFGVQLATAVRSIPSGPLLTVDTLSPVAELHVGVPGGRPGR